MDRYDPDYDLVDVMDKSQYGSWVRYDEAQAEIARLQAEVERLEKVQYGLIDRVDWASGQRDTARNDALEAAEKAVMTKLYLLSIGTPEEGPFTRQDRARDEVLEQAVEAIRALKTTSP